jgi:hypothetical protein
LFQKHQFYLSAHETNTYATLRRDTFQVKNRERYRQKDTYGERKIQALQQQITDFIPCVQCRDMKPREVVLSKLAWFPHSLYCQFIVWYFIR